ncbi:MAG TPA: ATP-binding protein [Prolixibacteraceae bacterium]|nr:ATP-binding protein [Prolixibacteraceae bacterium]
MFKSTKKQISIFIGILSLGIFAGFLFIAISTQLQVKNLVTKSIENKAEVLEKTIELHSKTLTTFCFDYTYWDEMSKFVDKPDSNWAKVNIESAMLTFETDYAWVYTPTMDLVYSYSSKSEEQLNGLPFDRETLIKITSDKFSSFFINSGSYVIEIHGAPIQPSDDLKRETEALGYFFIGRKWDRNYIEQLEDFTNSQITLDIYLNSAIKAKSDKNKDLTSIKILRGWDNVPVAHLITTFGLDTYSSIKKQNAPIYFLGIIFFALFTIAFVILIILWVNKPINLIFDALKNKDERKLNQLSERKDDFGSLASLVHNSFEQQKKLTQEITDRQQAESQLRMLSKAIDQSPDSIIITNTKGEIEFCNTAVMKISGFEREEIIGSTPKIFSSGRKTREEYQELWHTITSGKIWEGEFLNKKKNGDLYWESTTISPVTNSQGKITHYLAIRKDITKQKMMTRELIKAKERAEESDRLKSAFLANMSHEIRTPMNSIMGFASLLPDEDSKDIMAQYATIIYKNSEQLVNIIDGIVLYSKLQTHQLSFNPTTFEVQRLLNELRNMFKTSDNYSSITLFFDTPTETHDAITTDYEKLKQILYNIISNAFKYTHEGEIHVGYSYKENSTCEFYVSDTGIGIPKSDITRIFERFYRGSNVNESTVRGTGIGLSIVKELVELMGGTIWAESHTEDFGHIRGSKFSFKIPV